MQSVFQKYKGKMIRLPDGTMGVIVGYTEAFVLLLVEDTVPFSFSLDELGKDFYYIDMLYEEDCQDCFYAYCNEAHIEKYLKEKSYGGKEN